MEGLQFAQILADLSELQAADNKAALSLLTCNKLIPERGVVKSAKATLIPEDRPRFDRLGRRITSTPVTTPTISALQQADSDVPSGFTNTSASDPPSDEDQIGVSIRGSTRNNSGGAVATGTMLPLTIAARSASVAYSSSGSSDSHGDKELERAKTLMALYKIRGDLKQQQSPALTNAAARVGSVAEKYAKWETERQEKEIKEWEAKQKAKQKPKH